MFSIPGELRRHGLSLLLQEERVRGVQRAGHRDGARRPPRPRHLPRNRRLLFRWPSSSLLAFALYLLGKKVKYKDTCNHWHIAHKHPYPLTHPYP